MSVPHNLRDEAILPQQYNTSLQTAVECKTDFFLLPEVKTAPRGRFQDIHDINRNVTANLKAVPLGAFKGCFVQLLEIC
jgi:hypothetical protein